MTIFCKEDTEMKKGLTELVFLLDESGSMSGMEADTIGGFNSMIDKQRREAGRPMCPPWPFRTRAG